MFDVCVVGSANLDLVATVERLPGPGETVPGSTYAEYPGGKGLNQAVAAARAGAATAFVGAVGGDGAGSDLLAVMQADGIDISCVSIADVPSGRALIFVSSEGENSIVVVAGANDTVTAPHTPTARVVLAQLEVPVEAIEQAFTAARAAGAVTVLNPAPVKELPHSLLALCDVLTPNEHEVELLGGVAALQSLGAKAVIVTRGAEGADLHSVDGVQHIPAHPVAPVDTTGAGDAFTAWIDAIADGRRAAASILRTLQGEEAAACRRPGGRG